MTTDWRRTVPQSARLVAVYAFHITVAVLGTEIVESPYRRYSIDFSSSLRRSMRMEDLLSSVTAFALGFVVYWRWRPAPAKWLWPLALCSWLWRVLLLLDGFHGRIWEVSGDNGVPDFQSILTWNGFTLPLLRATFYSLGALVCWRFDYRHSRSLESAQVAPK
jgi:hypothetical protein